MTDPFSEVADTWVGRDVALFPNDTTVRHVTVVAVDGTGWEFEVLATGATGTKAGWKVGDRLYYSHSYGVVLAELDA